MSKQATVALIGAGLRGVVYTDYLLQHKQDVKLVAVADPNKDRIRKFKSRQGLLDKQCYNDWRTLLAGPKLADAVLICTQDHLHYEPTMRALEAGYHVLLEKPMSSNLEECLKMTEQANKYGKMLWICHVLRYTPFFRTIKKLLDDGAIGRLMSIVHNENVGYWHHAHSYVRGNWRNSQTSSPMILAKSCHDMDILLWLAGDECVNISSFGGLTHFKADQAPEGSPKRCLDGCPVAGECPYYAPKWYLTSNPGWLDQAISDDMSYEGRYRALSEGPYGRCVYQCDNDVVDHQVVNMEFANEVTAMFSMSAFTDACSRTIKLMGTNGEIRGMMEQNEIEVIHFGTGKREIIYLGDSGGHIGHGGGDYGLMKDFVRSIGTGGSMGGLTLASVSVQSHIMAFAAEQSRLDKRVIEIRGFTQI